jgi:hypothetical protein
MHRDRATPATGRENATRSTRPAPHASLPALLMLQRTIGNQAVLQTLVVQRTLDSTARKDWRELMIWDAHELEKVKSFIANHKEDVDELLHAVFEHKWRPEFGPVVNQLVEAGAGINFALEGGNTVLHKAAMREQAMAVEFLLKVSGST